MGLVDFCFIHYSASCLGMDRNPITRLFKTQHRVVKWQAIAGLAMIAIMWPTIAMHLFFWRIEHQMKLRIYSKPFFTLLPGSVHSDRVSLKWGDRLHIRSGSAAVRFPSLSLGEKFPISFEGKNLVIDFGPELKKVLGQEGITFDRVSAKLVIGSNEKLEIEFLDAESKTIQFHLKGVGSQKGLG